MVKRKSNVKKGKLSVNNCREVKIGDVIFTMTQTPILLKLGQELKCGLK